MDTGQEASEAIGRILDLEAFLEFGKVRLPSSSRENNSAGQIVWAEVYVGGSQDAGMEFSGVLCTGNSCRAAWISRGTNTLARHLAPTGGSVRAGATGLALPLGNHEQGAPPASLAFLICPAGINASLLPGLLGTL